MAEETREPEAEEAGAAGAEAGGEEPVAEESPVEEAAEPRRGARRREARGQEAAEAGCEEGSCPEEARRREESDGEEGVRRRDRERKPIVRLPRPDSERGKVKERRGVVVSSAMDKTVVVRVDTVRPHPAYKKIVRRSTKFHAHDEQNAAQVGDVVRIVETRPISKTKTWRLAEILEVAQ